MRPRRRFSSMAMATRLLNSLYSHLLYECTCGMVRQCHAERGRRANNKNNKAQVCPASAERAQYPRGRARPDRLAHTAQCMHSTRARTPAAGQMGKAKPSQEPPYARACTAKLDPQHTRTAGTHLVRARGPPREHVGHAALLVVNEEVRAVIPVMVRHIGRVQLLLPGGNGRRGRRISEGPSPPGAQQQLRVAGSLLGQRL